MGFHHPQRHRAEQGNYAVLKMGVLLKNPPGVEMFLNKLLFLKTYKRMSFEATVMKAFTRVSGWGLLAPSVSRVMGGKGVIE